MYMYMYIYIYIYTYICLQMYLMKINVCLSASLSYCFLARVSAMTCVRPGTAMQHCIETRLKN